MAEEFEISTTGDAAFDTMRKHHTDRMMALHDDLSNHITALEQRHTEKVSALESALSQCTHELDESNAAKQSLEEQVLRLQRDCVLLQSESARLREQIEELQWSLQHVADEM